MIKRVYFDVETSGLDPEVNGVLQLAMIIEVDNKIVDEVNLFIKPFTSDIVDPEALKINKLNPSEDRFLEPRIAFKELLAVLDRHIDKYNTD